MSPLGYIASALTGLAVFLGQMKLARIMIDTWNSVSHITSETTIWYIIGQLTMLLGIIICFSCITIAIGLMFLEEMLDAWRFIKK